MNTRKYIRDHIRTPIIGMISEYEAWAVEFQNLLGKYGVDIIKDGYNLNIDKKREASVYWNQVAFTLDMHRNTLGIYAWGRDKDWVICQVVLLDQHERGSIDLIKMAIESMRCEAEDIFSSIFYLDRTVNGRPKC